MKTLLLVAFLAPYWQNLQAAGSCDQRSTTLYEDLGCIPKFENSRDCPVRYDCESFRTSQDQCRLGTRVFKLREEIDENLLDTTCKVNCVCRGEQINQENGGKTAGFSCAQLDCPEFLGTPVPPGCYRTYTLGKCCSTGNLCPSSQQVSTCNFNGTTYREGERFFPDSPCVECVCAKGFDGSLAEPFCKKVSCATQIRHAGDLENYCSPVYLSREHSCCPTDFLCPAPEDTRIVSTQRAENDRACRHGLKYFNKGESFETDYNEYGKKRVKCECIMPPLMSCTAH